VFLLHLSLNLVLVCKMALVVFVVVDDDTPPKLAYKSGALTASTEKGEGTIPTSCGTDCDVESGARAALTHSLAHSLAHF